MSKSKKNKLFIFSQIQRMIWSHMISTSENYLNGGNWIVTKMLSKARRI